MITGNSMSHENGSARNSLLIAGGVIILLIIILVSIIITKGMLPLYAFNRSASGQVIDIKNTFANVKNFNTDTTFIIKSDNVPSISNQPLNFTATSQGAVDKSTANNPKSSGNFKISLAVQGSSFDVTGNYALGNQKFYYKLTQIPSSLPIDTSIENKWIYTTNDNQKLLDSLGNLTTKQNVYQNAKLVGITLVNGHLVYDVRADLSKGDLEQVINDQSIHSSSNKVDSALNTDLNNIVSGVKSASIEYYIGVFDHLPYEVKVSLLNNANVGPKQVSHTTFDIDEKLSDFNNASKVSFPTSATTLQQAH